MTTLTLTRDELVELTGYKLPRSQADWLRKHLRIEAPRRADGRPVVSRALVEKALAGEAAGSPLRAVPGPNWSKRAA